MKNNFQRKYKWPFCGYFKDDFLTLSRLSMTYREEIKCILMRLVDNEDLGLRVF